MSIGEAGTCTMYLCPNICRLLCATREYSRKRHEKAADLNAPEHVSDSLTGQMLSAGSIKIDGFEYENGFIDSTVVNIYIWKRHRQ